MSQDLTFIKTELKNCSEINSYDDLDIGQHVQYITIKDNNEYFYTGGKYKKLGDNLIILQNKSRKWSVPLNYKNKEGVIIYKTRFFVKSENKCDNNNADEYEKIIKTQQRIIEKLNNQLKKQTLIIKKIQNQ